MFESSFKQGLTAAEVEKKIHQKQTNKFRANDSKPLAFIIFENTFTLFNVIIFLLAIILSFTKTPQNLLFAFVPIINTIIRIIQELRAKQILKKLSLLYKKTVVAFRDNNKITISDDDIVIDDILFFQAGDQLLIDGIILEGAAEFNESLLTGESQPVNKTVGHQVFAGSYLITGFITIKVTAVGKSIYANKLLTQAKHYAPSYSLLKKDLNLIIKYVTFILLPLGLILTFSQLKSSSTWQEAITGSFTGIIGMIPEGLILLSTLSLISSFISLGKKNIIVQDLYAIETLARIDTLCLDKTGTLTEGKMTVTDLQYFDVHEPPYIDQILCAYSNLPNPNPTQEAIIDYFVTNKMDIIRTPIDIDPLIAFSSSRKWAGFVDKNKQHWVIGAPEKMITQHDDLSLLSPFLQQGKRALALAKVESINKEENTFNSPRLAAIVILADPLKKDVHQTLNYFQNQGVTLRVLSGDAPSTIQAIAQEAGIKNYKKVVDATALPNFTENPKIFRSLVLKNYLFARVTPEQKRDIIHVLQENKCIVAMIGDGVNDILALKEAHCSIAMSNGSSATKSIAQLIIMKDAFASLPSVILQGRKVINNIENVASLYLMKTIFSIGLAILFSFNKSPYPFEPIHLSLIGALTIGIPSFFLTFSPRYSRPTNSFLYNVLIQSLPVAFSIILANFILYLVFQQLQLPVMTFRTLTTLSTLTIGLSHLFHIMHPLNRLKSLLLISLSIAATIPFFFPLLLQLFHFEYLPLRVYPSLFIFSTILAIVSEYCIPKLIKILHLNKKRAFN